MAVERTIKDNFILTYREKNTKDNFDFKEIVKTVMGKIGYAEEYEVLVKVGNQGIMYGYACNETDKLISTPIYFANKLARGLKKLRFIGIRIKIGRKTQVSVEFRNEEVHGIATIIVSVQVCSNISQEEIKNLVINHVIREAINPKLIDKKQKF